MNVFRQKILRKIHHKITVLTQSYQRIYKGADTITKSQLNGMLYKPVRERISCVKGRFRKTLKCSNALYLFSFSNAHPLWISYHSSWSSILQPSYSGSGPSCYSSISLLNNQLHQTVIIITQTWPNEIDFKYSKSRVISRTVWLTI